MHNITVATPPDRYHADQPEILFVVPDYLVSPLCSIFEKADHNLTLYFAPATINQETLNWLAGLKKTTDYVVLDMSVNEFYNGFFLDSPKTMYYNNEYDISSLNTNEIEDAADFALKYIGKQEVNEPEI